MKKRLKVLTSFFRLNWNSKKDVILIIVTYLRVSCLISFYPLRKYYHKYFEHDQKKAFDFMPFKDELKLIQKVIKHMPGKHTCLKESIIVHLAFKRKGLEVPIYLGVRKENKFMAHAWYDLENSQGYSQLNGV